MAQNKTILAKHLRVIWANVDAKLGEHGIRERNIYRRHAKYPVYPSSTFHTYWAFRCLQEFRYRFKESPLIPKIDMKEEVAALWIRKVIANQTMLHAAGSEAFNADELAWAIATMFVLREETEEAGGKGSASWREETIDGLNAALGAFFAAQLDSGTWRTYQPLFHYPEAGNAYCYTFETLTELLRPALTTAASQHRRLFRPFVPRLLRAWTHARETALRLHLDRATVGWSSGHHAHRTTAEGWATAVVFSYLQCLRCLIGVWTREAAEQDLGVHQPRWSTRDKALATLAERGDTWVPPEQWNVGEELAALFVHPIEANPVTASTAMAASTEDDPDLPLLLENQARSAILFGPPGTSKTTIAEAIAGSIRWKVVEVHASDFVIDGMDKVPHRADYIFRRLMELDHCVVLFDEIDELLREREDSESDPFGRFLTTSMLPKVARLWEQRRIVYFVATNDISKADRAIRRSQRFDAAIFVAPPSFRAKMRRLEELLPNVQFPGTFTHEYVENHLDKDDGIFALLRYDQIDELANSLKSNASNGSVELNALYDALRGIDVSLAKDAKDEENGVPAIAAKLLEKFRRERQRDQRMIWLFRSTVPQSSAPARCELYPPGNVPSSFLLCTGTLLTKKELVTMGFELSNTAPFCIHRVTP